MPRKKCAELGEELKFDEACVELSAGGGSTGITDNLWLYALSADCHDCPFKKTAAIQNASIIVDTAYQQYWRVFNFGDSPPQYIPALVNSSYNRTVPTPFCELTSNLGQFGHYRFTITRDKQCNVTELQSPSATYAPLFFAAATVLLALCGLGALKTHRGKLFPICPHQSPDSPAAPSSTEAPPMREKRRVRALDAVRGISILAMIFVNSGAGGYRILEHATWDGLTLGDLIFPCFMWIMGVCVPLALTGQLRSRGLSKSTVCASIVKRSLELFLIGLALKTVAGNNNWETFRAMGVLQRFGVSYLITATTYALTATSSSTGPPETENARLQPMSPKMTASLVRWLVAGLLLGLHCGLTFFLPVPDCPRGYLGPGGISELGKYLKCVGGAAGYVDRVLLGEEHLYQGAGTRSVYASGPFDPENVLGCLTSAFQTFIGVQVGQILLDHKNPKARIARWTAIAVVCGVIGCFLHFTNFIPINKNLWSVSFVLVTTSISAALLILCYVLLDVLDLWDGGPFRIPGMNALLMYVGHELCYKMFPFHWSYGKMNTHGWLLAENLWCVAAWTCVAYALHARRIYLAL